MSDDEKFDVRVVERNIALGAISESEYKKYLKNLPDAAGNADFSPVGTEDEKPGSDEK